MDAPLDGGRVVATGTPKEVADAEGSATAPCLARRLGPPWCVQARPDRGQELHRSGFEVLTKTNRFALIHRLGTVNRAETKDRTDRGVRGVRGHARPARGDPPPEGDASRPDNRNLPLADPILDELGFYAAPVDFVGYGLLAVAAAMLGTLGGLGGAVLLVPVLVLTGMSPSQAAPLGLLTVAAGSVAAGPHQLRGRLVNHRLGMVIELAAAAGAVAGALVSGLISETALTLVLAAVAFVAAVAGMLRRTKELRNPPDPACVPDDVGERIGSLDGAYPLGDGVVPYRTHRLWEGIGFMGVAGLVAGTAGVSGGFIKTPVLTDLMRVPMKVAAATSTFTVGITASAALIVFAIQGRIDVQPSALVITGSLIGGQLGARLQARLPSWVIRRVLSIVLIAVSISLVSRA